MLVYNLLVNSSGTSSPLSIYCLAILPNSVSFLMFVDGKIVLTNYNYIKICRKCIKTKLFLFCYFVALFGVVCANELKYISLACVGRDAKNLSYRFDLRFVFLMPIFATSLWYLFYNNQSFFQKTLYYGCVRFYYTQ